MNPVEAWFNRHFPNAPRYGGTIILTVVVLGAAFVLWWAIVIPMNPIRNYYLLPLLLLMHVFAFFILYSYAKASLSDPGFVPYGWVSGLGTYVCYSFFGPAI